MQTTHLNFFRLPTSHSSGKRENLLSQPSPDTLTKRERRNPSGYTTGESPIFPLPCLIPAFLPQKNDRWGCPKTTTGWRSQRRERGHVINDAKTETTLEPASQAVGGVEAGGASGAGGATGAGGGTTAEGAATIRRSNSMPWRTSAICWSPVISRSMVSGPW